MNREFIYNMSGKQINIANDSATINATQNNSVSLDELEMIVGEIKKNLGELRKEDADSLEDTINTVKRELMNNKPEKSRLHNSLSLIVSTLTVANGIPVLVSNLQKLINYIEEFVK